jgi:hypothetical protein
VPLPRLVTPTPSPPFLHLQSYHRGTSHPTAAVGANPKAPASGATLLAKLLALPIAADAASRSLCWDSQQADRATTLRFSVPTKYLLGTLGCWPTGDLAGRVVFEEWERNAAAAPTVLIKPHEFQLSSVCLPSRSTLSEDEPIYGTSSSLGGWLDRRRVLSAGSVGCASLLSH